MSDIERIKSNIQALVDNGAPETDIDAYVASEGVSLADLADKPGFFSRVNEDILNRGKKVGDALSATRLFPEWSDPNQQNPIRTLGQVAGQGLLTVGDVGLEALKSAYDYTAAPLTKQAVTGLGNYLINTDTAKSAASSAAPVVKYLQDNPGLSRDLEALTAIPLAKPVGEMAQASAASMKGTPALLAEFLKDETHQLRAPKNATDAVNRRWDKKTIDYLTMSAAQRRVAKLMEQDPDLVSRITNAENTLKLSSKYGQNITPAEALSFGEADPLIKMQAELSGHPVTGASMAKMNQDRLQKLNDAYGMVADSVSPVRSADEAAQAVKQRAGDTISTLRMAKEAEAAPLYKEAFRKQVPTIQTTFDNPYLAKEQLGELDLLKQSDPNAAYFLNKATDPSISDPSLRTQVFGKPENSVAVLDAAKKLMDQAISKGEVADVKALTESKNKIVALADKYANPQYAQARGIYSSDPDFFKAVIDKTGLRPLADMESLENAKVPTNLLKDSPERTAFIANQLGDTGKGDAMAAILRGAMETNPAPDMRGLAGKMLRTGQKEQQLRAYSPYATDALTDLDKIGSKINTTAITQGENQSANVLSDVARTGTNTAAGNKPAAVYGLSKILTTGRARESGKYMQELKDLLTSEKGLDFVKTLQKKRAEYLKLYKSK